jgi:hypothetical protein
MQSQTSHGNHRELLFCFCECQVLVLDLNSTEVDQESRLVKRFHMFMSIDVCVKNDPTVPPLKVTSQNFQPLLNGLQNMNCLVMHREREREKGSPGFC